MLRSPLGKRGQRRVEDFVEVVLTVKGDFATQEVSVGLYAFTRS